jgi:hypothetical protein
LGWVRHHLDKPDVALRMVALRHHFNTEKPVSFVTSRPVHRGRRAAQQHDFLRPVELIDLARREAQCVALGGAQSASTRASVATHRIRSKTMLLAWAPSRT